MTEVFRPEGTRPLLTSKRLALAAAGYATLMLYGSLVPLQYRPLNQGELLERVRQVFSAPLRIESRSDFLANILLAVPLSFLLSGSLCLGRPPGVRQLLVLPAVCAACVAFGALVECLQLFFPPRDASLNDIVAQGIGAVLGSVLWAIAGERATGSLAGAVNSGTFSTGLLRFLPLYLLFLLALESVPFDFTLSPAELVHKWREGRICPIPFAAFLDPSRDMPAKTLWTIVLFLPAGLLLGTGDALPGGLVILLLGFLIAGGVEFTQLFVLSRYFEATDIVVGAAAVWAGWGLVHHWRVYSGLRVDGDAVNPARFERLLLPLWIVVIAAVNWYPFTFSAEGLEGRAEAVLRLPFADYQQKHYLYAFDDLLHKLLLFVPLGLLLAAKPGRGVGAVLLLGGTISALVEAGQLLVPERYASLSDVLLGTAGSLIGWLLVTAERAPRRPSRPRRIDLPA